MPANQSLDIIHLAANALKENRPEESIAHLKEMGTDQDVMWLICYFYSSSKMNDEAIKRDLHLLILFLKTQGVKPEYCYRGNVSAEKLLLKAKNKDDILPLISHKRAVKLHATFLPPDEPHRIKTILNTIDGFIFKNINATLDPGLKKSIIRFFSKGTLRKKQNDLTTHLIQNNNIPTLSSKQKDASFFTLPNKDLITYTFKPIMDLAKLENVLDRKEKIPVIEHVNTQMRNRIGKVLSGIGDIFFSPYTLVEKGALHSIAKASRGVFKIITGCIEILSIAPLQFHAFYLPPSTFQQIFRESDPVIKAQNRFKNAIHSLNRELTVPQMNKATIEQKPLVGNTSKQLYLRLFNRAHATHQAFKEIKKISALTNNNLEQQEKTQWKKIKHQFVTEATNRSKNPAAINFEEFKTYSATLRK